jgi:hypothetical protein
VVQNNENIGEYKNSRESRIHYVLEMFPVNRFRVEILQINSRAWEKCKKQAKVPELG